MAHHPGASFCNIILKATWCLCLLSVLSVSINCEQQPRELQPPRIHTDWDRVHFPNPKYQSHRCGRRGHETSICDPNNMLQFIQANELDRQIVQVFNDTRCPCAEFVCSEGDINGYGIWVALVDGMKEPTATRDPNSVQQQEEEVDPNPLDTIIDRSRLFAYTQYVMWELTPCDVVILYSTDQNVVYTITGDRAAQMLTDDLIADIAMDHRLYFENEEDVYRGLKNVITDYRAVFLQEYESYMARAYRQQSNPKIGGSTDSSGSTLSMAGFLVLCAWTVSTIVALH